MNNGLLATQHYTEAEAAALLTERGMATSVKTIRRERDRGRLGFRKIAGKIRIGRDQLEAYIERMTVPPCPASDMKATGPADTRPADTGRFIGTTREIAVQAASELAIETIERQRSKLRKKS